MTEEQHQVLQLIKQQVQQNVQGLDPQQMNAIMKTIDEVQIQKARCPYRSNLGPTNQCPHLLIPGNEKSHFEKKHKLLGMTHAQYCLALNLDLENHSQLINDPNDGTPILESQRQRQSINIPCKGKGFLTQEVLRFLTNIGALFDPDDPVHKQKLNEVVMAYQKLICQILFDDSNQVDTVWDQIKIEPKYYFRDRKPESVIELGNGSELEKKKIAHYQSKQYFAFRQVQEEDSSKTSSAIRNKRNDDWASSEPELNCGIDSTRGQGILFDEAELNKINEENKSSSDEDSSPFQTDFKKGWDQRKALQHKKKVPTNYQQCSNQEFSDSYQNIPFQVPYAQRQSTLQEIENNYRAYIEISQKGNYSDKNLRKKQESQSQTKTGPKNQTSDNKDSQPLKVQQKNESPGHLKKLIPHQQLYVIGSSAEQSQLTPGFQKDASFQQVEDQSLNQQRKGTGIFQFEGNLERFFCNIDDKVKERLESMYQSFRGTKKRARWMVNYFTGNKPPGLYDHEFQKFMQYLNSLAHECSYQVSRSAEDDLSDPPSYLLKEFEAIFALQSDSGDQITDDQQSHLQKEADYNDEAERTEQSSIKNKEIPRVEKILMGMKETRQRCKESLLNNRIVLPERFLADMVKEFFLNQPKNQTHSFGNPSFYFVKVDETSSNEEEKLIKEVKSYRLREICYETFNYDQDGPTIESLLEDLQDKYFIDEKDDTLEEFDGCMIIFSGRDCQIYSSQVIEFSQYFFQCVLHKQIEKKFFFVQSVLLQEVFPFENLCLDPNARYQQFELKPLVFMPEDEEGMDDYQGYIWFQTFKNCKRRQGMTLMNYQKDEKREGQEISTNEQKGFEKYSSELAQFAMASSSGTGINSSKKEQVAMVTGKETAALSNQNPQLKAQVQNQGVVINGQLILNPLHPQFNQMQQQLKIQEQKDFYSKWFEEVFDQATEAKKIIPYGRFVSQEKQNQTNPQIRMSQGSQFSFTQFQKMQFDQLPIQSRYFRTWLAPLIREKLQRDLSEYELNLYEELHWSTRKPKQKQLEKAIERYQQTGAMTYQRNQFSTADQTESDRSDQKCLKYQSKKVSVSYQQDDTGELGCVEKRKQVKKVIHKTQKKSVTFESSMKMTTSFNDQKLFRQKYDKGHDQENVFGDILRMNDMPAQRHIQMSHQKYGASQMISSSQTQRYQTEIKEPATRLIRSPNGNKVKTFVISEDGRSVMSASDTVSDRTTPDKVIKTFPNVDNHQTPNVMNNETAF